MLNAVLQHVGNQNGVYLDAQGSERPRPEAVEAITYFLSEGFGNPSATAHRRGRHARTVLESSREHMGAMFNLPGEGVTFTSGATEANNAVMRSFGNVKGARVVASAIEHKSILTPATKSIADGGSLRICPVNSQGLLDLEELEKLVRDGADLVSVMHANNELGTVQPIREVASICHKHGAILHVDGSQTAGRLQIDVEKMGIDILTISGHKFGGPTGVGALIVRPALIGRLTPLITGGSQEGGLRAGTTPIAQCIGMAVALNTALENIDDETRRLMLLRDGLLGKLRQLPGFFQNGDVENRLPCNINGGFAGVEALALMRKMPNVDFSAGSACTTGASDNHVLDAIGLPRARQKETFRVSLSWSTTESDIVIAGRAFQYALNSIRGIRA